MGHSPPKPRRFRGIVKLAPLFPNLAAQYAERRALRQVWAQPNRYSCTAGSTGAQ
jgi:hypothetical protein